jgi:hypothetical protein
MFLSTTQSDDMKIAHPPNEETETTRDLDLAIVDEDDDDDDDDDAADVVAVPAASAADGDALGKKPGRRPFALAVGAILAVVAIVVVPAVVLSARDDENGGRGGGGAGGGGAQPRGDLKLIALIAREGFIAFFLLE